MTVAIALLVILAILVGLIVLFVKVRRKGNEGKPPKTMKDRFWGVVIAVIALAIVMLFASLRTQWKQQQIQDIVNSSDSSQQAP